MEYNIYSKFSIYFDKNLTFFKTFLKFIDTRILYFLVNFELILIIDCRFTYNVSLFSFVKPENGIVFRISDPDEYTRLAVSSGELSAWAFRISVLVIFGCCSVESPQPVSGTDVGLFSFLVSILLGFYYDLIVRSICTATSFDIPQRVP